MKHLFVFITTLLLTTSVSALTLSGNYALTKGSLNYHVHYIVKHVQGKSTNVKGKGICKKAKCSFIVAAPIKSFVSKDSNRDVKMQTVTKAAQYPMVVVRVSSESTLNVNQTFNAQIKFAGVTKEYKNITLKAMGTNKAFSITGILKIKLSDFKIERPTLLAIAINDELPIDINLMFSR